MKTIVLVDLENMPAVAEPTLETQDTEYVVFYGIHNKQIPVQLIEANAKLIKSPKVGKDALDICLAYYFGKMESDLCRYVIISKDKGYDSMIAMVNAQHETPIIFRSEDYRSVKDLERSRLDFIRTKTEETLKKVIASNNYPKNMESLRKFMVTACQKISPSNEEIKEVISEYIKKGKVKIIKKDENK